MSTSTNSNFRSEIRTKEENKRINSISAQSLSAQIDITAVFELMDDYLPQLWDRNLPLHADVATFISARCASIPLDSLFRLASSEGFYYYTERQKNPLKMRLT